MKKDKLERRTLVNYCVNTEFVKGQMYGYWKGFALGIIIGLILGIILK